MRSHLMLLSIGLLLSGLASSGEAGAGERIEKPRSSVQRAGRGRPGDDSADGRHRRIPWIGIGLGALTLFAAAPFAWRYYLSTRQELDDMATVGMRRERAARASAARTRKQGAEAAATPRDLVWDALTAADDWMAPTEVATRAGLSERQAQDELAALVDEGYVTSQDRAGATVFRAAS